MSARSTVSSNVSDSLLAGKGYSPDYGLNDSSREEEVSEGSSRWFRVTVSALTACIASLVTGMSLSFSSILIQELSNEPEPSYMYVADTGIKSSMIGGLVPIGGIIGGIAAWPATEYLGRQAALIIGSIPALIGWLLISLSILASTQIPFLALIFVGRFLTGISSGWSMFCVSIYIAEVAASNQRGTLGNCNQLFVTFGVMLSYIFGIEFNGVRLSYYIVALIPAAFVALFEVLMLFTYETPRWLFGKNKDYEAIRVLKVLRGPDALIMREIDHIKAVLRKTYSVLEQIREFRNRSVYLPFIIVVFLMFFQQFSGINAAIFYASSVFKSGFQGNMVEIVSAIAVGITQVIATMMSVFLVEKLGRRVLLLTSSFGMGTSSLLLAVFYYFYHDVCKSDVPNSDGTTTASYVCQTSAHFNIMAIVAVVIFIASFSLGWGPIPWAGMSELLPNKVRGLAAGICTLINWSFATIITLCFHSYLKLVSAKFAWGTFTIFLVLSFIFVFLFMPETKGISLEQIQINFERGNILAVRLPCLSKPKPQSATSVNSIKSEIN